MSNEIFHFHYSYICELYNIIDYPVYQFPVYRQDALYVFYESIGLNLNLLVKMNIPQVKAQE